MTHRWSLRAAAARIRKSRIGLRVFAFNLLVLFLPVAGILYLDVYEERLLDVQERGMVEQARLVAASLADTPDKEMTVALLDRLGWEGDSRIRVFDAAGHLVADSRRVIGTLPDADAYSSSAGSGRDPWLYRIGAWLVSVARALVQSISGSDGGGEEQPVPPQSEITPELRAALKGEYGAHTRPTPGQRSLTLHSAIPIKRHGQVVGAVVVSQSTFRTLQALYALRLRMFEVVVASIIVATLLSVLMSATIVRPLVRLRHAAIGLAERKMPLAGTFNVVDRRDEVGDLARALEELATRLDAHIRLLESFAADVSHEFRNPLGSIRNAAEMLLAAENSSDRERFFNMLTRDVDRLERLVSGVRELARIDAQLAQEKTVKVDITGVVTDVAESMKQMGARVTVAGSGPLFVRASRDRLCQVFENMLANARSFAANGDVDIAMRRVGDWCEIQVSDSGPGIPEAHLDRVFDRFFTYRPNDPSARREHSGLGLAIVRTIVEGYGGSLRAENRPEGGARFIVRLPVGR